jgi:hypothetical protein
MDYSEFTREQIESALKALRTENAIQQKTISDLKKENKILRTQCEAFEGDRRDRFSSVKRHSIH